MPIVPIPFSLHDAGQTVNGSKQDVSLLKEPLEPCNILRCTACSSEYYRHSVCKIATVCPFISVQTMAVGRGNGRGGFTICGLSPDCRDSSVRAQQPVFSYRNYEAADAATRLFPNWP